MKRCNCTLTHSRNITPKTKNKFNAGNGQQLVVDVKWMLIIKDVKEMKIFK